MPKRSENNEGVEAGLLSNGFHFRVDFLKAFSIESRPSENNTNSTAN